MLFVIGCGGVGSWLAELLAKLPRDITLVDGDTLEEKNLDRQLFSQNDIGQNKAEALAVKYDALPVPEYFHAGLDLGITSEDILFCCADNHTCAREILSVCDEKDCRCVIGKNEYTDAEAYWYERDWKDTPNDPRVFYPTILTDHTGDPLSPCTGEAQIASPQLVLANAMAANFMAWLFWFHTKERKHEYKEFWPVMHKASIYAVKTTLFGDRT